MTETTWLVASRSVAVGSLAFNVRQGRLATLPSETDKQEKPSGQFGHPPSPDGIGIDPPSEVVERLGLHEGSIDRRWRRG